MKHVGPLNIDLTKIGICNFKKLKLCLSLLVYLTFSQGDNIDRQINLIQPIECSIIVLSSLVNYVTYCHVMVVQQGIKDKIKKNF